MPQCTPFLATLMRASLIILLIVTWCSGSTALGRTCRRARSLKGIGWRGSRCMGRTCCQRKIQTFKIILFNPTKLCVYSFPILSVKLKYLNVTHKNIRIVGMFYAMAKLTKGEFGMIASKTLPLKF